MVVLAKWKGAEFNGERQLMQIGGMIHSRVSVTLCDPKFLAC